MLCLVPQYFARTASAVGICTLLADVVYVLTCPTQLKIRFPGPDSQQHLSLLDFRLGWCFYATLCAGSFIIFFSYFHTHICRCHKSHIRCRTRLAASESALFVDDIFASGLWRGDCVAGTLWRFAGGGADVERVLQFHLFVSNYISLILSIKLN